MARYIEETPIISYNVIPHAMPIVFYFEMAGEEE